MKIKASNLSAQLSYRGRGNPANAHPVSAISNCFPGLEFDFRAAWRRMFVGLELSEHNNYVVTAEERFRHLQGRRLLLVDDGSRPQATAVATSGTQNPGLDDGPLSTGQNPNGVSFMEWSNNLVRLWEHQGKTVACWFSAAPTTEEVVPPKDADGLLKVDLELRAFFASDESGALTPALNAALAEPGELGQGLCSPWQNDYRECACYYWAASRPDYVNVTDTPEGVTTGEHWLSKQPTGGYVPDDRKDPRLWSYDDLFKDWQGHLRFIIGGTDAEDRRDRDPPSE